MLPRSRSLSRVRALQDGRPPTGDHRRCRGRREHRRLLHPARRLVVRRLMLLLLLLLQAAHDLLAHVVVVVAPEARHIGHDDFLGHLVDELNERQSL